MTIHPNAMCCADTSSWQELIQPIERKEVLLIPNHGVSLHENNLPNPESESKFRNSDVRETTNKFAHPVFESLTIRDCDTGKIIQPNTGDIIKISNEWLDLDMMIMMRTPNIDDTEYPEKGSLENQKVSQYFQKRQRRFEFQYQVKLKKVPVEHEFFLSIELDKPLDLSFIARAVVKTCLLFAKNRNPGFHFSTTGHGSPEDGKYEKTHMAFPVEKSMDRLVITKPGETPPELGKEIMESPELAKKRKNGKFLIDWNTQDIYTMSIWSHYFDWPTWKVMNIPATAPFSLHSIMGDQKHTYLQMYLLKKKRKEKSRHYQKDIEYVVNLKFSTTTNIENDKEMLQK